MADGKSKPAFSLPDFTDFVKKQTTLVGLDIGTKTLGVAVSDTLWLTSTPLKTIFRKSFQYDMNELASLLKGREIGCFISGLPLQMNAEEGEQAKYTREQAEIKVISEGGKLFKQAKVMVSKKETEGEKALAFTEAVLEKMGIDCSRKRARRITDADYGAFDYIIRQRARLRVREHSAGGAVDYEIPPRAEPFIFANGGGY